MKASLQKRLPIQYESWIEGAEPGQPRLSWPPPPRYFQLGNYTLRRWSCYHPRYGDQQGFWRCKQLLSFLWIFRLQVRPRWITKDDWDFETKRRHAAHTNHYRLNRAGLRTVSVRHYPHGEAGYECLCGRNYTREQDYRRHYDNCIPF